MRFPKTISAHCMGDRALPVEHLSLAPCEILLNSSLLDFVLLISGEIIWLLVFETPRAVKARLSWKREVVATGLIILFEAPFYLFCTIDFISTIYQKY